MRTRHLVIAAGVGVLAGIGIPLASLWRACRLPESEACVWGRAYLTLSLGIGAIIGIVVAIVAYALLGMWARRRRSGRGVP